MPYKRDLKLIKFTKDGLDKMRVEREQITLDRPAAVKELTRAREMGDLSENGLYHAAKSRLRSMDSRLRRLSHMMKLADVVASPTITVEENGKQLEYSIVGDFEADPGNFKISPNSPIGRALNGRKVGEKVSIETPKGTRNLTIIKVS